MSAARLQRTRDLLKRRARAVPRGLANAFPMFINRAHGAKVVDVDGRRFIDFAGGIGVVNVGHTPAKVVKAIERQAARYLHSCFSVAMYDSYVELAEQLNGLVPGPWRKKTMFANSGAEGVENAVKIARHATGRSGIVAFENAFHGRTFLGMSLTGKVRPYKQGFGPLVPDVFHAPYPYCYRCPFGLEHPNCESRCLASVEQVFRTQVEESRVAAVIVEPVQGEGGFVVPPPGYLRALAKLCRTRGVLLIADEVQTGVGRTGTFLAVEQSGVAPDLVVMGKSLAAGLPLSSVTGRAEIMDTPEPGALGGTFGGNPLACVAGLAVLDEFTQEDLAARAVRIGTRTMSRLREMQERHPLIGDVRGLGAMVAVELVRDRKTKEPATEEALAVLAEAHRRGLIVLKAGLYDNVIRLLTPLVTDDRTLDRGLDILEAALAYAERHRT